MDVEEPFNPRARVVPLPGPRRDLPPQGLHVANPSVEALAHEHAELEKRGLIRREPGKPRSIELLVAPEELPILR